MPLPGPGCCLPASLPRIPVLPYDDDDDVLFPRCGDQNCMQYPRGGLTINLNSGIALEVLFSIHPPLFNYLKHGMGLLHGFRLPGQHVHQAVQNSGLKVLGFTDIQAHAFGSAAAASSLHAQRYKVVVVVVFHSCKSVRTAAKSNRTSCETRRDHYGGYTYAI